MKITRLTTFIVPPRWCFLKIETDEGITGWGECLARTSSVAYAAVVEHVLAGKTYVGGVMLAPGPVTLRRTSQRPAGSDVALTSRPSAAPSPWTVWFISCC